jgi:hypothetical protein
MAAVGKHIHLGFRDLRSQLLAQMHHDLKVKVGDAHAVASTSSTQHSSQARHQHPLKLSVQLMSA